MTFRGRVRRWRRQRGRGRSKQGQRRQWHQQQQRRTQVISGEITAPASTRDELSFATTLVPATTTHLLLPLRLALLHLHLNRVHDGLVFFLLICACVCTWTRA
jgi:hypothetical protein